MAAVDPLDAFMMELDDSDPPSAAVSETLTLSDAIRQRRSGRNQPVQQTATLSMTSSEICAQAVQVVIDAQQSSDSTSAAELESLLARSPVLFLGTKTPTGEIPSTHAI